MLIVFGIQRYVEGICLELWNLKKKPPRGRACKTGVEEELILTEVIGRLSVDKHVPVSLHFSFQAVAFYSIFFCLPYFCSILTRNGVILGMLTPRVPILTCTTHAVTHNEKAGCGIFNGIEKR